MLPRTLIIGGPGSGKTTATTSGSNWCVRASRGAIVWLP